MSKVKKTITLDKDLADAAKTKLAMPLSTFLNLCLQEELNASDEIEEVKKEIREYESHLTFLRSKLCRLEKDKQVEIDSKKGLLEAFNTLERIHSQYGKIGENQIDNVAMYRKVDRFELLKMCNDAGFEVVKGLEPVKEGKSKKFYS